ncbi:MAG: DUF3516 domain-containing protein, partial [Ilumatobacter sp.]|nr:DUF3516 domain-containing protein [Ilumatobacter sp.]
AAFGWVELLATGRYDALAERCGWPAERLAEAMAPYWDEYDAILTDGDARSTRWYALAEATDRWTVTQQLADPEGDGVWRFTAAVDVQAGLAAGAPTLVLETLGPFDPFS